MEAYEPEAPLSPVHAPEYSEYLAPSDDDIAPAEDQPLPASPIALSPGYITDSEPIEDGLEEDPEIDPVDYETEPFETDEAVATPPPLVSPHTYAVAPIPPSPPPSPLSPLLSPLPRIPSLSLMLPLPTRRDIILEADIPLQKRARYTALSQKFEIGESSAVAAARQPVPTLAQGTELNFMTALEEVKESVADMATRHRQDSEEIYTRHQDAQDDRALLWTRSSTLARERQYYRHIAIAETRALQQKRRDDHDMWTRAIGRIQTLEIARDPEHLDGPGDASSSC
ncbi:hypothetical protein Tco_0938500 [Tanacetum coccineum]|uniref:Uncharacterized protein n=1 Tax=Tanacetum coccineum TaxID=301880 RepID=A0ABQ5DHZ9_9ASTR